MVDFDWTIISYQYCLHSITAALKHHLVAGKSGEGGIDGIWPVTAGDSAGNFPPSNNMTQQ